MAKKLLVFDDPSRKFGQLNKMAQRLGQTASGNGAQSANFRDLFFNKFEAPCAPYDRSFSTAFALSYARRFTDNAFLVWAAETNSHFSVSEDLAAMGKALELSNDALAWCAAFASAPIPWTWFFEHNRSDELAGALVKFGISSLPSNIKESFAQFERTLGRNRTQTPADFLPDGIFIVEGTTELILLPHFAKCLGTSLNSIGLQLIPAGGANQVSKRFIQMREFVELPLFCLLDADATEQASIITDNLRPMDRLFVLSEGEIEDTIDETAFVDLLNVYLQHSLASSALIRLDEFIELDEVRKTDAAKKILRQKASIDFDKVEFARMVSEEVHSEELVPDELEEIIATIVTDLSSRTM